MANEWKNLTNGSFKGYVFHVALPTSDLPHGVSRHEATLERRLQIIERPLVDGGSVRDFGAKAIPHTAEIVFHGPNYLAELEKFKAVLSQGTPGSLILPDSAKAVTAAFHRLTESSDYTGEAKGVNVTWIEHSDNIGGLDQAATASGLAGAAASLADAKANLDSSVSNAQSILTNNPFLTAVRTFESGISTIRKAANTVVTLTAAVRNRITQLEANVKGTLNLLKEATDSITSTFGSTATTQAVATGLQNASNSIVTDPDTGQRVSSFTEPDTVTAAPDPLAPPELPPEVAVTTALDPSNATTPQGVQAFADSSGSQLQANREELSSLSSGRTDDLSVALTAVSNALQVFAQSVASQPVMSVVTPFEMSLAEVLFANGISVDLVDDYRKKNTGLADIAVIPGGSVVNL